MTKHLNGTPLFEDFNESEMDTENIEETESTDATMVEDMDLEDAEKEDDEIEGEEDAITEAFYYGTETFESFSERQDLMMEAKKKKWAKDIKVKKGKMHTLLKVPDDKNIEDVYTSGEKLAKDLIKEVGKEKAAGMINFAANINKEKNIYDDAQKYLSDSSNDKK